MAAATTAPVTSATSTTMAATPGMATAHVTSTESSSTAAVGKAVPVGVMRFEMTVIMVVMIPTANKEPPVIVGPEIAVIGTERRPIVIADIHARAAAEEERRGSHGSRQHLVLLRIHDRRKIRVSPSQGGSRLPSQTRHGVPVKTPGRARGWSRRPPECRDPRRPNR